MVTHKLSLEEFERDCYQLSFKYFIEVTNEASGSGLVFDSILPSLIQASHLLVVHLDLLFHNDPFLVGYMYVGIYPILCYLWS